MVPPETSSPNDMFQNRFDASKGFHAFTKQPLAEHLKRHADSALLLYKSFLDGEWNMSFFVSMSVPKAAHCPSAPHITSVPQMPALYAKVNAARVYLVFKKHTPSHFVSCAARQAVQQGFEGSDTAPHRVQSHPHLADRGQENPEPSAPAPF